MALEKLCSPALLYLGFSLTQIIIDIMKNMYNSALVKFPVMIVFTILLNILCKRGLGTISWFIVFIPFIAMTFITTVLLYVFGLSATTGKADVQSTNNSPQASYSSYASSDSSQNNASSQPASTTPTTMPTSTSGGLLAVGYKVAPSSNASAYKTTSSIYESGTGLVKVITPAGVKSGDWLKVLLLDGTYIYAQVPVGVQPNTSFTIQIAQGLPSSNKQDCSMKNHTSGLCSPSSSQQTKCEKCDTLSRSSSPDDIRSLNLIGTDWCQTYCNDFSQGAKCSSIQGSALKTICGSDTSIYDGKLITKSETKNCVGYPCTLRDITTCCNLITEATATTPPAVTPPADTPPATIPPGTCSLGGGYTTQENCEDAWTCYSTTGVTNQPVHTDEKVDDECVDTMEKSNKGKWMQGVWTSSPTSDGFQNIHAIQNRGNHDKHNKNQKKKSCGKYKDRINCDDGFEVAPFWKTIGNFLGIKDECCKPVPLRRKD
jgi:hypothetical protein